MKISVAVIGCGSIGERHVRAFLATGRAEVILCDNRPEVLRSVAERYGVRTLPSWEHAVRDPQIDALVIATPAPLHVPMATSTLTHGKHVLCEKPLSTSLDGIPELMAVHETSGRFAAVAYVLRFVPALRAARQFLREGSFGPVRHVAVQSGQHFPQFRPQYREIYYRDRNQGGGAIQDALTHLMNAVEWTVGPITRLSCDAAHQVLEGVDVEDTVNVSARHGEVLASYAMNQFQAPNETRFDFHAVVGTVRVELHRQRWGVHPRGASDWTWHSPPVAQRDDLYIEQAAQFLTGCAQQGPGNLCTLADATQTLRDNLAALRSLHEQRAIAP
jgi:predicted dehydrogenase